ncbi:hypothetical protein HMPREF1865_00892 [Veillonella parvula]|nr:hypothetical protein HMPREF1865_00892 [Veillonella parvula]
MGSEVQQDGLFFDNSYNLNNRIILIIDFLLQRFYYSSLMTALLL